MIFLLIAFTGCHPLEKACNLMYAPDTLHIEVVNSNDWEGSITAIMSSSDGTITCEVDEIERPCDELESTSWRSEDRLILSLWGFSPDSLDIQILVDGIEVANEPLEPTYSEDEPNGEGCGFRSIGNIEVAL